ncbi:MAG: carbohydrate binding family 9 domain-containing protein [Deferribacteres bacterium]|nr:carbohydrate binding family 9 domain-containing protein [candidate division KSB1 bacterium]MCB9503036.1 carbohydrate binding family 9 domain-containing protein [Deferribacteres bacterium]
MTQRIKPLITLLLLFAIPAFAKDDLPQKRIYTTAPINPHPPVIDGDLNDPVWEKVNWGTDFIQRTPDDGGEPSFETAFKIVYDDKNLYVAIRAFDPEPDKVEARVTRRDQFEGDWVEIQLDSYFDQRTSFSFTVNAAGVKGDEAITKDGEGVDANWNPVWYAEVKIDEHGWAAEMRIPFSQLRFSEKAEHVWGMQLQRRIFRKDERSTWQHIPRTAAGYVSLYGELHGIQGIQASRRIELLPYSLGQLENSQKVTGNPFATGQKSKLGVGFDGKMGVTSDLTLDLTVNPDFGQVEADPSELNLTAFETFFEEKRPFFIEGQDILRFKLTQGDGSFSSDQLFYTRRIGRSPQYYYEEAEGEYVNRPTNTSILAAAKLTGKTRSGVSVGLFNAITQEENIEIDYSGDRRTVPVEPQTNYFVSRLSKDIDQGNTIVGAMFTATNRNLTSNLDTILPRSAFTGGFDLKHQWDEKTYYINFKTAFSSVRGDKTAIYELQTNPRHYFQRPDADHVTLDSSRTTLGGFAATFDFGKSGNGKWMYAIGATLRSPGFDLNDVGYLRSGDTSMQYVWVGYRINKPVSIFRQLGLNFNQWTTWNFGGDRLSNSGNVNGWGQFNNYWQFNYGVARYGSGLSASSLRGGPSLKTEGEWRIWTHLISDSRNKLYYGGGLSGNSSDDGFSKNIDGHIDFIYQPIKSLSIWCQPFFVLNHDNFQYISTETIGGESKYVMARLKQKTSYLVMRINYSLTPNLSVQYYGQPFFSAGKFSKFKEITQSRAEKLNDRYIELAADQISENSAADEIAIDYDRDGASDFTYNNGFNFREFKSNLVLRWEYHPGSTVFLVWSQTRFGDDTHGNFSYGDEWSNLFSTHADNIFLIKFNRWISL